MPKYQVKLKRPHEKQSRLIHSPKKRVMGRAGRRSGKTTGLAGRALLDFIAGRRVLYATPTAPQLEQFWHEIRTALSQLIDAKVLRASKTDGIIERPGTKNAIRLKTAWDADTLRGDYADMLILDEYQLMNEDAWELVGAPMLIDNAGSATFLYTPPSLRTRSYSRARDKLHAAKMFKRAEERDDWEAITFTSLDNPHLSAEGLSQVVEDMTALTYRMEILAEDIDEAPGALWKRSTFGRERRRPRPESLSRVVVGVDPTGSLSGEVGIVAAGLGMDGFVYILDDASIGGVSPDQWARQVVYCHNRNQSDWVIGEVNFGGDMVESTVRTADASIPFKSVWSSRGKAVRAEPVSALYEQNKVFHCGEFPELEDQMCMWVPGETTKSPDRIDALVFAVSELAVKPAWSAIIE